MIMRSIKAGAACVVGWRSKKLKRVVTSSTATETLAANETVREMVYIKAVLREILGDAVDDVSMELFTDSKNMWEAVHIAVLGEDQRLRTYSWQSWFKVLILEKYPVLEEYQERVC